MVFRRGRHEVPRSDPPSLKPTHSSNAAAPRRARIYEPHAVRTAPAAPGGTRPPANPRSSRCRTAAEPRLRPDAVLDVPSDGDGTGERLARSRPAAGSTTSHTRAGVGDPRAPSPVRTTDERSDIAVRSDHTPSCARPDPDASQSHALGAPEDGLDRQSADLPEFLGSTPIMFIMLSYRGIRGLPWTACAMGVRSSGTGLGATRSAQEPREVQRSPTCGRGRSDCDNRIRICIVGRRRPPADVAAADLGPPLETSERPRGHDDQDRSRETTGSTTAARSQARSPSTHSLASRSIGREKVLIRTMEFTKVTGSKAPG